MPVRHVRLSSTTRPRIKHRRPTRSKHCRKGRSSSGCWATMPCCAIRRGRAGEIRDAARPASSPFPAPRLGDGGLIAVRDLRFTCTGLIAHAAEELAKTAAAFDQPSIFAVWARRIAGTATTSNFARALGKAWQGRGARWAPDRRSPTFRARSKTRHLKHLSYR